MSETAQPVMAATVSITVRLYGLLRDYHVNAGPLAHRPFTVVVPADATVATLVANLHIPVELVAGVAVNGETAVLATPLHEGDQVRLFPPVAGGSPPTR